MGKAEKQHDEKPCHIVVIGNGMVGQRFMELLIKKSSKSLNITCIGDEKQYPYNRMLLTEYFEHRDVSQLSLCEKEWYIEHKINVVCNTRVLSLNTMSQHIVFDNPAKEDLHYDTAVLATGSAAYVPTMPGCTLTGVFVYRTISDLDEMIQYGEKLLTNGAARVGILGGGLLGLEAAKAVRDLGCEVTIIERNPHLMPRQLDADGSDILMKSVRTLGVSLLLNHTTIAIHDNNGNVSSIVFKDNVSLPVDMVIFATGIRPRDDVAKASNIATRVKGGGIIVNDFLETNVTNVYAIGECASHNEMTYGLVAPGYSMASVLASRLVSVADDVSSLTFDGGDLSTKLKLMGVEVASFGAYQMALNSNSDNDDDFIPLVYNNPSEGVYKKLLFSKDSKTLLGGMLVGDTSQYPKFLLLCQNKIKLKDPPSVLLFGSPGQKENSTDLPDSIQVCSCNNVTKGDIKSAVVEKECVTLKKLKGTYTVTYKHSVNVQTVK